MNTNLVVCIVILLFVLWQIIKIEKKMLISDQNTGQKYKFEIRFVMDDDQITELILYSDYAYRDISSFLDRKYIVKQKNFYMVNYNEKQFLINECRVMHIEFVREKNQ